MDDQAIYNDWNYPWQFQFLLRNQKVRFGRHSTSDNLDDEWYFVQSSVKVSLNIWTHVAVTWDHKTGNSTIYVNGQKVGYRTYPPREVSFHPPTGKQYRIGNDGQRNDHQFYGSVMDLYVFGTALSLDQINKVRGSYLIQINKRKSLVVA